ncbi:MAG TPA: hypothetical protein DCW74_11370 [Alteromonas australica]|uniref:Uncharacterized protein n=1 Tax=Alteromonas australica TaxID=589873 RepID=A0A350P4V3_9ALTE|nr:hypothetical protein [Alteromonas australica]|tara:strand:+ start:437 stop:1066 length:630 start_codon:yes stop_codon:yes gene_type:complete
MATNITGSVSLVYGAHNHSETFNTTASTLTNANEAHDYSAGGGRAVVGGSLLDTGTIDGAEGLLLIKNDNNFGALGVSFDGTNYDISIPAKVANLISVGPTGPAKVKADVAGNVTNADVVSVTTAGGIVFGSSPTVHVGTAIMTASSGGDFANDLLVEIDSPTTGTVFELDGVTKKDLKTGEGTANGYDASTTVNLVYITKFRYTLTEA